MFLEEKKQGEAPTTLEPWQVVMLKAADVLVQRGHCQGVLEDSKGRVCVAGALVAANGGQARDGFEQRGLAWDCYKRLGKFVNRSAVSWNDNHETTTEMVISALRNCAKG